MDNTHGESTHALHLGRRACFLRRRNACWSFSKLFPERDKFQIHSAAAVQRTRACLQQPLASERQAEDNAQPSPPLQHQKTHRKSQKHVSRSFHHPWRRDALYPMATTQQLPRFNVCIMATVVLSLERITAGGKVGLLLVLAHGGLRQLERQKKTPPSEETRKGGATPQRRQSTYTTPLAAHSCWYSYVEANRHEKHQLAVRKTRRHFTLVIRVTDLDTLLRVPTPRVAVGTEKKNPEILIIMQGHASNPRPIFQTHKGLPAASHNDIIHQINSHKHVRALP